VCTRASPDDEHDTREHDERGVDDERQRPDAGDARPSRDDADWPDPIGDRAARELQQRVHEHEPGEGRADRGVAHTVPRLKRPEERRERVPDELPEKPEERGEYDGIVHEQPPESHQQGIVSSVG